ncbi:MULTISPECIES: transposase [unclassified Nitratiruptor]|uniref:transposase n=1 Tax=unclassified Nitratiruptor TaxID=2624044 RepID=UPI0019169681|nr:MULTISPECIES: transposase [unclassified Nitratiruptor]
MYSGDGKDGRAFTIKANIEMIHFLQSSIEETNRAMMALFDTAKEISKEDEAQISDIIDNLRTIPGVSDKTILALLAEYGPLDRFYSVKALVGYLGLYLSQEQSGESIKGGHLAKRGARLAKRAIYLAAIAAVRHNDELRQIYLDYRSKRRAKKECLIIVARKLLAIIYAIYKHNVPYEPKRVFVANPIN